MILYHFTAIAYAHRIVASGALTTTESNIGSHSRRLPPAGPSVGPDVVWLTSRDDAVGIGNVNAEGEPDIAVDKLALRIAVDLGDAVPWVPWAIGHGINRRWLSALTAGNHPETWFVVERPIPLDEWVEVVNMRTAKTWWRRGQNPQRIVSRAEAVAVLR